jgi:plasmid replication initiation protein
MDEKTPRHALDTFNHVGVELQMSNALVRAADRLHLTSKRLVWSCIAKANLQKNFVALPNLNLTVKVTAQEYMEAFNIDAKNAYAELKKCAKDLQDEMIEFRRPTGKRGKRGMEIVRMRWVGRATYNEGEGWVEVAFWHEVVPHLVRLEKEYTQIKLQQASALRSRYSWDLLRLFSQFKSTGFLSIPIEEFHHAMNVPPTCRKDFGQLNLRVIKPAVKELTEKDGLLVTCEPKKMGRKVVALNFTFKPDPQQSLSLDAV